MIARTLATALCGFHGLAALALGSGLTVYLARNPVPAGPADDPVGSPDAFWLGLWWVLLGFGLAFAAYGVLHGIAIGMAHRSGTVRLLLSTMLLDAVFYAVVALLLICIASSFVPGFLALAAGAAQIVLFFVATRHEALKRANAVV